MRRERAVVRVLVLVLVAIGAGACSSASEPCSTCGGDAGEGISEEAPRLGRTECIADGTVALGGACAAICAVSRPGCAEAEACVPDFARWNDLGPPGVVGACAAELRADAGPA